MFLFYFLLALIFSTFFTWLIRQVALKNKIVDWPDSVRKKHLAPVPLLGGMAIFLTFWLTVLVAWRYCHFLDPHITARQLLFLFFGTTLVIVFGFFDDKYKISPWIRLLLSVVAVILVLLGGMHLTGITNPFGAGTIGLDYWKIQLGSWGTILVGANILMFLWLLGMMYTTKILDGLDGLSTGVSIIGALMIAALANTTKFYQPDVTLVALIFAGACLGFLFFNFSPAKIFLGEGGSLFLGLLLGVFAVISGGKIATALLVMAVPIIDLAWVIGSRIYSSQSWSQGDRRHLHYRLVDAGLSERVAVLLLYTISFLFGITTLFLSSFYKLLALIILLVVIIFFFFFYPRRSKNIMSSNAQNVKSKKGLLIFLLVAIVFAFGLKIYSYYWPSAHIVIKGKIFTVLLADTPNHWRQGLSGRNEWGKYDGMLFIFGEKSQHTMVMREMNFPLDIVWLDGERIVDMAPNLKPEKGVSESQLTPYMARLPSTRVLELPAGFVAQNNLKIGDEVKINK